MPPKVIASEKGESNRFVSATFAEAKSVRRFICIALSLQMVLFAGGMIVTAQPVAAATETGGGLALPSETPSAPSEPDNLTVENVTIEGNRLVSSDEILGVVKTHRGDKFDREQVMRDLKAINGMGYFDDRALQAVPELNNGSVLLKIRVQENAPVTQFAFQGNSVLSSEDLSKLFADQLGKPQNLTQLSGAIDKVEQAYHERGYALARVTDVKDDPDGSVSIKIDEGKIGEIKIVGNKKTKDFIIRQALKLHPGEVYNERTLTADLRKLYGNGYFSDIKRSLKPDPNNPDKYQLEVQVDEKRTASLGLGGGVDTLVGPFGSFSAGDNNWRGRGQILSVNTQVGSGMLGSGMNNQLNNAGNTFLPTGMKMWTASVDWADPNFKNTGGTLAASAFGRNYASMMISQASQQTIGSSLTYSKQLSEHLTGSLSLSADDTILHDMADRWSNANGNAYGQYGNGFQQGLLFNNNGSPGLLTARAMELGKANTLQGALTYAENIRNQQLRGGAYATISPTLFYRTTDDLFDPHKGVSLKITGGPSIGLTGNSFLKGGVSASKFFQVTKGTTLATNIQGGGMLGNAPAFSMFRMGGFNGIRGYRQFSDLGTGSRMLMGSMELRHRLPLPSGDRASAAGKFLAYVDKNVRGTAWFDYGAVGGNSAANRLYGQNIFAASVGVGLRLNVPMLGLVRLDYGLPLVAPMLAGGKFVPRFTVGFGDKF